MNNKIVLITFLLFINCLNIYSIYCIYTKSGSSVFDKDFNDDDDNDEDDKTSWTIEIPQAINKYHRVIQSCTDKMWPVCQQYYQVHYDQNIFYYCCKLYDLYDCFENNFSVN